MLKFLVIAVLLYVGSYVGFRQLNAEVDRGDRTIYVTFPDNATGRALLQVWRPLIVLDEEYTGIRTGIGRRRDRAARVVHRAATAG
jgi:hypothetical protein